MSAKKKPSQEARERLSEKVADVRLKSEKLHAIISNISEQPIARAEEVLKEKSKTKFLAKYSKVSTELEECLNQLLLLTDAIASLEDSDDESEEYGDNDDDDDDSDSQSIVSVVTNATTVTLEHLDSQETKYDSHESLTSIVSSISAFDTFHRSVSENENFCNNKLNDVSACVSLIGNGIGNLDTSVSITGNISVDETTKNNVSSVNESKQYLPSLPLDGATHKQTNSIENEKATKGVGKVEKLFPVLTDVIVESFKWEADVPYPVIVPNTYTPMNFYVQLVNPENDVMEQLCMHFLEEASNGYYGGINYVPLPESFCCAKSSTNGPWYRAKIILIHNQPNDDFGNLDEASVKVFFIDEGYEDIVKLSHIRPLDCQFATLPAQSLKCILGGVQPIEAAAHTETLSFHECDKMWSTPSISFFEKLVQNGNICTSYFYFPPKNSYLPPHNISLDTLVCDLYIVSPGSKVAWWKMSANRMPIEDHIAFKMIVNKMAAHCQYFNSELTRKKSMKVLEQYMNPESSVVTERVVNTECSTVIKQESDTYEVKKVNVEEHKEVKKEAVDMEERISLPSSQRREFQREKSLNVEERKEMGVRGEKVSRSIDENINLSNSAEKSVHETHQRKISPVHKNILPEREINERRNQIVNNDPRWPADEKPVCTKNEKFFPSKKTLDSKPALSSTNIDIKKEDPSVISYTKGSMPTKPPLPAEFKYFKFGNCFKETILTPEPAEGFAKVLVSEVINPSLFYVHLVNEEVVLLDKLMTELNIYYNEKENDIRSYSKNKGFKYETGNAIAVHYSADNMWYRAVILSIRTASNGKHEYEILFVDFGSGEWVSEDCVLPIIEEFCNLPMEIIACSIADVKPCSNFVTKQIKGVSIRPAGFESPDDDSDNSQTDSRSVIPKWPEQATLRLKALILTQQPMMVSLKTAFKNADGLYEVYLFDTADNKDVFINQLLVDEGLASSDVFCKVAPSVQVSEIELEQKIAEDNAMAAWDPMKEQFLSKRNVYSVDVDDAGVASLGYVQQKKNVCNNFLHRGYCYRGDNCKYVHALPGDPIYDSVEVFCDDTILDLPKPERCVPVVIRALLDPTHFWVNFPYGIDWDDEEGINDSNCGDLSLDKLHQSMNLYYSKLGHSRKTNLSILAEGELIAAKFHQDGEWYRARVINTADDLVQVFYVDYGNTDVITEDNTNALLPDFLHLPFQAVECFLFNTYMEDEVTPQHDDFVQMRIKFRDMVADKVLMAYIVSSSITKSIVVMLYNTTTEPHIYINEVVRSWHGIIHKDVNDFDSLKDRLLQDEDISVPKISYIPG